MRVRNVVLGLAAASAGIAALGAGAMALRWGPRDIVGMMRYDSRVEGTLAVGDPPPDVELLGLNGERVPLAARLGARPVVLIFGSFT